MESELEKGKAWAIETLRRKAAGMRVPMLKFGHDYWWIGERKTTLRFADNFGLPTIPFTAEELESVSKDANLGLLLTARIVAALEESLSDTPDKSLS